MSYQFYFVKNECLFKLHYTLHFISTRWKTIQHTKSLVKLYSHKYFCFVSSYNKGLFAICIVVVTCARNSAYKVICFCFVISLLLQRVSRKSHTFHSVLYHYRFKFHAFNIFQTKFFVSLDFFGFHSFC